MNIAKLEQSSRLHRQKAR